MAAKQLKRGMRRQVRRTLRGHIEAPLIVKGKSTGESVRFKTKLTISL
jgi:hypothetical protein